MIKKAIPLAINNELLEIEKLYSNFNNKDTIKLIYDENVLHLKCTYIDQTFYFIIKDSSIQNNKIWHSIIFMPTNDIDFTSRGGTYEYDSVKDKLNDWFNIINLYFNAHTPFYDVIEKKYEEQILEHFKILDEDADRNQFRIDIQLKIGEHLNLLIDDVKSKMTDENTQESNEIIEATEELKNTLGKDTKNVVLRKYAKIAAKIWKMGYPYVQGLVTNYVYDKIKDPTFWISLLH